MPGNGLVTIGANITQCSLVHSSKILHLSAQMQICGPAKCGFGVCIECKICTKKVFFSAT